MQLTANNNSASSSSSAAPAQGGPGMFLTGFNFPPSGGAGGAHQQQQPIQTPSPNIGLGQQSGGRSHALNSGGASKNNVLVGSEFGSNIAGSEPVSVDELEAILRDWNIEDGEQVISCATSSGTGRSSPALRTAAAAAIGAEEARSKGSANAGSASGGEVDLGNWSRELIQHLKMCTDDNAAVEITTQMLSAFENQVTAGMTSKRNSLAHANRILVKTLQRMHRQHKSVMENVVPNLQKELEEQRTKANVAESRCRVLELHLQQAMSSESGGGGGGHRQGNF